jgi:hypothetical protein
MINDTLKACPTYFGALHASTFITGEHAV